MSQPPVVEEPVQPRPVVQQGQTSKRHWVVALFAAAVVAAVIFGGILPRVKARADLRNETGEMAIPTVMVVHPKRTAPSQEVVLPANVQAFIDSPIYARTNGYLKKWYVDIGAHVKAGQLLAEIDTPEVNQQLQESRADLATAEANLNLSQITAERYTGLLKTDSVSKQDADNANGDLAAKKAVVESAQYNVKRLEELHSFEKIYAPFDGIITARNTDVGALIDSGAGGGVRTELFHIASPGVLRVYVNVPEAYVTAAKPGIKAKLTLAEYPGKFFEGTLVRTANAIDQVTRTLLAEIQVKNPTGQLLTGAYAQVHFAFAGASSAYLLPVNSLLFRSEGLRIATVKNNGEASLVPIVIGRDYGNEVEVVSGLQGDESVITDPPDSIIDGEKVQIAHNRANGGA